MKISINISIYFLVSVACITILAPFSIDAYIPATVDISRELLASSNSVQLSIAIFLMGFSLGPLIFGPLSDAFGRRKLICLSLIFFSLFSFLCSLSTNIYLLIFFRFFQAVSESMQDFERCFSFLEGKPYIFLLLMKNSSILLMKK